MGSGRKAALFLSGMLMALAFGASTSEVQAYETWTDCTACHGGFRSKPYFSLSDGQSWADGLHDGHRNLMLSRDCDACHVSSGRSPVFLNDSVGGTGLPAISCVGCHGRAEDRFDAVNIRGDGAGLRQHHFNAGETICATCHTDADPVNYTPVGENVPPPYYFTPDGAHPDKPTDSCNPGGEEDFFGSMIGLDNDGDLAYDTADSDCAPPADIDVLTPSLDFGSVTVGNTATLMATIQNLGGQDLTVNGFTFSGSPNFDLNVAAPVPPFLVPPGGFVDVLVDYIPSVAGADSGALDIASDDPDEPTVSIALSGSGIPPVADCVIDVGPPVLDYGPLEVGNVLTLMATIVNNGTTDCTVTSLAVTGADFSLAAGAPTVPFTVALGQQIDVPVDYSPSDIGIDSGALEVGSNDPIRPTVSVALAGTGIAPRDIDVSPAVLDFGIVAVFSTTTLTTTIQNVGGADLTVTGLTLTGSAEFTFNASAPAVPFTLAGGGSMNVSIDYTPVDEGSDAGTLEVASDDPDEPVVAVSLLGTGEPATTQCDIDLVTPTLDFGPVEVGTTVSRYVIIDNLGDADCVVSSMTITGDPDFQFNPAALRAPFTVEADGFARGILIDYTPTGVSSHSATLELIVNDLDEPTVLVPLSGNGTPPVPDIQLSPSALDFGETEVGRTTTRTIGIQNQGQSDLTVTGMTVTGSADFALSATSPAAPFVVVAGDSVNVSVDYTPSATGSASGALEITSDDPDEPSVVASLSGTGIPPLTDQDIDVSPLVLDFGVVDLGAVGLLSTTIQNLGERDLTVTGLTITGSVDFALAPAAPALPFVVASGSSVVVPVNYVPLDEAADVASLDVASDDPDEPVVFVSLAGTGIIPIPECDINVVTPTVDFGSVDVGSTALRYAIVDNLGDADCVISSMTITGDPEFQLNPAAPVTPFTVEADGFSRGIPIDYTPLDIGSHSATLELSVNDPDEPNILIPLSGNFLDCNGNGIPDDTEPESAFADLDGDNDVDGNDFLTFSNCYNGSLNPPLPGCVNTCADLDDDGDVDANDFLTFSNCINGSLNPPNCP